MRTMVIDHPVQIDPQKQFSDAKRQQEAGDVAKRMVLQAERKDEYKRGEATKVELKSLAEGVCSEGELKG